MNPGGIDKILAKYEYKDSSLIAILQDVQEIENYLSEENLEYISENLPIPLTRIYRIATFYNAFSLTPRGKYTINVCLGTACHVRGAARVLDGIRIDLGIDVGGMTADGLFSLETVNCLGACAMGPIVVIGSEYHGQMTPAKVESVLKKYRKTLRKKDEKH
ncbi:MAG: NAD(P)H-dependent oxidoreductase subunit E [Deltaproteobacteria bacterium]|nr:NAD(P)H-dependent oxidoreductase subunit E [Deltaproteobacteria bacterium]